ncbi:MAG TPA: hypothetical protein VFK90_01465 [Anaeromyxobacter sp.]|nr:hypothetical protein [Anaeromyxobacter sp.]
MRALPVLSTASLAVVLACNPSGSGSPGKADGEACSTAAECRSGLCFRAPGAAAAACASSEPAAAGECPPPGAQIITAGPAIDAPQPTSCQTPVRAPATNAGDIAFIDLGEAKVGDTLRFTLPSGTTSFSIVSQAVATPTVPGGTRPPSTIAFQSFSIPNSVVPTSVVHVPTGTQYYSDTEALPRIGPYLDATSVLAYYGGLSPISGAFTVPNTSKALDVALTAGELPSGEWSFVVNDFAFECLSVQGCFAPAGSNTSAYHVQVLVEQRPFTSTGALDVEVYLATSPASELRTASAAASDPQFQRWARSYASYLAKAGICVRNVTVHDLPSWVVGGTGYAPNGLLDVSGGGQGTPPGCDDLSQLFTLGLAQNRAVHLFMADALVAQTLGGFTVLGVDGSIPGPSGVPGTINGGAVVGVTGFLGGERTAGACSAGGAPNVVVCGTDALALVSAHETGHWLGLYHTTEFDGTLFDPLTDTASCPCLQCAPFALRSRCAERNPTGQPTFMLGSYCTGQRPRCGGARNLMFWLFDDRFAIGDTSRQQGDVMRRNPAVR